MKALRYDRGYRDTHNAIFDALEIMRLTGHPLAMYGPI